MVTTYAFVSKRIDNVILIDTRGKEAAQKGHIQGAFSIHCGTGMRAQMAHSALKNAGYKTRFLNNKFAFIKSQPICCFKE